jgi:hypothetical protein
MDPPFLISLIRPENVPSWRVAEKLGFEIWRGTIRAGWGHLVYRLDPPAPDLPVPPPRPATQDRAEG